MHEAFRIYNSDRADCADVEFFRRDATEPRHIRADRWVCEHRARLCRSDLRGGRLGRPARDGEAPELEASRCAARRACLRRAGRHSPGATSPRRRSRMATSTGSRTPARRSRSSRTQSCRHGSRVRSRCCAHSAASRDSSGGRCRPPECDSALAATASGRRRDRCRSSPHPRPSPPARLRAAPPRRPGRPCSAPEARPCRSASTR